MRFRRDLNHGCNRLAGIFALILAMVHGPLPQPDYHNIRHQDGAGEFCEHHDHLLRRHPGAGFSEDVVVLHWHWFFLTGDRDIIGLNTDGPKIHAHFPDWDATIVESLKISADTASRCDLRQSSGFFDASWFASADPEFDHRTILIRRYPQASQGIIARGVSLQAVLHRWDC